MSESQPDAFSTEYARLNEQQRAAVDAIEGPVMVIAGPGTGKTQILTLRIANILKQIDVSPSGILAITFTDSGAKAMRTRLQSLIGDAAYDVSISTFHAFADGLVREYPDAYAKIIGGRAASEIERIETIERILTDTSFKAVRPSGDPSYYVKPLLRAIQTLKQENTSPDDFAVAVNQQEEALRDIRQYHEKGAHKGKERGEYKDTKKFVERNQELLSVYRQYEAELKEMKRYDFDDMILETVRALEGNEEMLRSLQERFQYVLADEHQDVNGAQNRILELLMGFHDAPNIFVVGDEKQAIYRFQGASMENFLYFGDVYPDALFISLTENYRSGQAILDAAHEVIKTEDPELVRLRVPLRAAAVESSTVVLAEFPHTAVERDWIVGDVQRNLDAGLLPEEIAIIVRTNREVEEFAIALRKRGIAVAPSADSDILEHPLLASVRTLMRLLENPADASTLTKALHEPYWNLAPRELGTVLQAVSRQSPLVNVLSDTEQLDELGVGEESNLRKILPLIHGLKKRSTTTPPHRLLELLLVESGLVNHVLQTDPEEGARVLRRLYDEVEGMVERREVDSLTAVERQFTAHCSHEVALPAPFITYGTSSVQVMTAHKSKGLEFSQVYIPRATDKAWGAKTAKELFRLPIIRYDTKDTDLAEEDERRLFYVAMTRAKERVTFTIPNTSVAGKELLKSRFLSDIPEVALEVQDVSAFLADFSPLDGLAGFIPHPVAGEIMLHVLDARGFSPTAFNNYLQSPWEYFFRNVLRIPQVKTTELQFGTAVHTVLDELVRFQSSDTVEQWLSSAPQILRRALDGQAISDEEFTRLHQRGSDALVAFLPHLRSHSLEGSRTEFHLEAVLPTGNQAYPLLKLNGNLDRVDFKDGKLVRVTDYKTGKPKSRNHIEGKAANSDGAYKRQLVFYALLLSLQPDSDLHCRTGVLSFVEPAANGSIKEESFDVSDEDIRELKDELVSAVGDIVSGEALHATCDSEKCHYCDLVTAWEE